MISYKKIISFNSLFLPLFIITGAHSFQDERPLEPEWLSVYELCLEFEQAYNNIAFQGLISFSKDNNSHRTTTVAVSPAQIHEAVSLIKEIKSIKKNKNALLHISQEKLQEIKVKLITALQEIELLKKSAFNAKNTPLIVHKESVYKLLVKALFKVMLTGVILNNSPDYIAMPLSIVQIYFLFGFGKASFNALCDVTEKVFNKIW